MPCCRRVFNASFVRVSPTLITFFLELMGFFSFGVDEGTLSHSVESQPQNPEFRNNPESFHPCSEDKELTWNPSSDFPRPRPCFIC